MNSVFFPFRFIPGIVIENPTPEKIKTFMIENAEIGEGVLIVFTKEPKKVNFKEDESSILEASIATALLENIDDKEKEFYQGLEKVRDQLKLKEGDPVHAQVMMIHKDEMGSFLVSNQTTQQQNAIRQLALDLKCKNDFTYAMVLTRWKPPIEMVSLFPKESLPDGDPNKAEYLLAFLDEQEPKEAIYAMLEHIEVIFNQLRAKDSIDILITLANLHGHMATLTAEKTDREQRMN